MQRGDGQAHQLHQQVEEKKADQNVHENEQKSHDIVAVVPPPPNQAETLVPAPIDPDTVFR